MRRLSRNVIILLYCNMSNQWDGGRGMGWGTHGGGGGSESPSKFLFFYFFQINQILTSLYLLSKCFRFREFF